MGFAIVAAIITFRNKNWKRPVVLTLFLSVACILLGALLTMLTGQHGEMTLKPDVANNQFTVDRHGDSKECELPFSLTLDRFEVETYPGTRSPMDFVSYLQVTDGNNTTEAKISMNNILKHKGYRFYQSDYDDEGNSVLSVAHDPWGIAVTYAGYILLLLAIVLAFTEKNGEFRTLIRKASGKVALLLICFTLGSAFSVSAANEPRTLPKASADKMGQMYVMYKGRVCPLQTLAKDKGGFVQEQLGIEGKYARMTDFLTPTGENKLTDTLKALPMGDPKRKKFSAADEKYQPPCSTTASC